MEKGHRFISLIFGRNQRQKISGIKKSREREKQKKDSAVKLEEKRKNHPLYFFSDNYLSWYLYTYSLQMNNI